MVEFTIRISAPSVCTYLVHSPSEFQPLFVHLSHSPIRILATTCAHVTNLKQQDEPIWSRMCRRDSDLTCILGCTPFSNVESALLGIWAFFFFNMSTPDCMAGDKIVPMTTQRTARIRGSTFVCKLSHGSAPMRIKHPRSNDNDNSASTRHNKHQSLQASRPHPQSTNVHVHANIPTHVKQQPPINSHRRAYVIDGRVLLRPISTWANSSQAKYYLGQFVFFGPRRVGAQRSGGAEEEGEPWRRGARGGGGHKGWGPNPEKEWGPKGGGRARRVGGPEGHQGARGRHTHTQTHTHTKVQKQIGLSRTWPK